MRFFEGARKQEIFLLTLLAAVVAALTFAGAVYYVGMPLLGALYAAVRSVGGGNDWNEYGWPGNVGAWLALLLISWVAVKAAMLAFAASVDAFLCRFRRGHTIVCGLGERGRVLSEALLQAGDKVTVLDLDHRNLYSGTLRAQGTRVVVGDATSPEYLRLVRADRARRIVAVLRFDDQNAAVAYALRETFGPTHPVCHIHNSDTATWSALLDSTQGRVVPFSVADSSSVELFLEYDLGMMAEGTPADIYGTGPLAESVLIRAAKVWQAEAQRRGVEAKQSVRVIGPGAEDMITSVLPMRYPGIDSVCNVSYLETPHLSLAEDVVDCALDTGSACPTVALVASGERDETARMALVLARWLPEHSHVFAVVPSRSSTLDLLLAGDPALANRLKVVDVSRALEDPSTLLGGPREELARLAHEDWLRTQLRQGSQLVTGGPLQHWEDLRDDFKASNRNQIVALFDTLLPAIGAVIVPIAEWDAAPFVLDSEEIEELARLEHERWCDERERAGWVLDRTLTERDAERKRTPWLVPYEELPEEQKDNDRDVVTRIPVMVARAGFRLKRTGGTPSGTSGAE